MGLSDLVRRALPRSGDAPAQPARSDNRSFAKASAGKANSPFTGFTWMGNIWLIYSVFFIIDPITRHSTKHWIALAVVYPFFLAVYFSSYLHAAAPTSPSRGVRDGLMVVLSMFLLGAGYLRFNVSSGGIIVYAAAFLPFILESAPLIFILLGAGSLVICAEAYFFHLSPWSWISAVFFSFIVAISNLAVARQKRADSKLRMAHEEIEHLAKVAERERIARDLHDVLGHTLSVIVLKAELAGRLIGRDPARMAREIADVEQIARKALAEVREAIGGYRSEGLVAEIERARRTLDAAGVELHCGSQPPHLSPAEETVLSLVLREAVTNIVRHAGAHNCGLEFLESDGHYSVVLRDDGRGGIHREGNGLRGMRERVEALGGRFSVDAAEGTRLTVQLPIAPQSLEAQALESQILEPQTLDHASRRASSGIQPTSEDSTTESPAAPLTSTSVVASR